jgi:hypothetical protein
MLSEHADCVIDFGAGHSVYEDDQLFNRVQQVLAPYRFVVLVLPSPDLDESVRILNTRAAHLSLGRRRLNEHLVRHHSNFDLAKFTV